jgi:hypothetical protein
MNDATERTRLDDEDGFDVQSASFAKAPAARNWGVK